MGMRVRNFSIFTVLFGALIMMMSATPVCAQKFKYKPLPKGTKPVTVPDGDMEGLLIDHSISLDIDVRRFANRLNPATREYEPLWDKDIAKNYLELFDSFLSDEARQKLQETDTSSTK